MATLTNKTSKKQLLDPIGTLCHLIGLAFKPINSKIGIYNHAIIIQEASFFQWIDRYINCDSREVISLLYNIIIRIIEWYVIPLSSKYNYNPEFDISNNDFDTIPIQKELFWLNLKKTILYASDALDKLQYTYYTEQSPTNVVLALQLFINTLKDSVDGRYSRKNLPRCIIESQPKTFLDYDKIKYLWTATKLKEIIDLYEKCFEIDLTNDSAKEDKIRGYMSAIDMHISIHDDEFRKLIVLSNEG
jgi:hypothetical protein